MSTQVAPAAQVPPSTSNGTSLASDSSSNRRKFMNLFMTGLIMLVFLIAAIPLFWILSTVLVKGWELIVEPAWWQLSQRNITVREEGGGAYHAIYGTVLTSAIASAIAIPIGVLTAVYLIEYGSPYSKLTKAVSFMVDILTGIPSIVSGLFIYAIWVTTFGWERVAFAVGLALTLLMIPVVVRSTEEMLKLVPNELREASYALGVPKWKTIMSVVLPTAFSGIVTGILLGLARVMGETAPFLILGPYSASINYDAFQGSMASLQTMIDFNRVETTPFATDRTWAAALTLIMMVLSLSLLGRFIAWRSNRNKAA